MAEFNLSSAPIVRKRAVYECGCARAVEAPSGQEPRPPMQCPEHNAEWVSLETEATDADQA